MTKIITLVFLFSVNVQAATRNVVPRAAHEGNLGTAAKPWSGVYVDTATGLGRIVWADGTIQVSSPSAASSFSMPDVVYSTGGTMTGSLTVASSITATTGITCSTAITAAYYQIAGSTVLAILPGLRSMAVGSLAGAANTGNDNLFIGYSAGNANTAGANNMYLGSYAGMSATGSDSVGIGYAAGRVNSGIRSVFIGSNAGYNVTGNANNIIGYQAGNSLASGIANNIFGYQAGYVVTGGYNTFLGYQAGFSVTTGTGNIIIGDNADAPTAATNNYLNIGGAIYGDMQAASTITFVGGISADSIVDRTPYPKDTAEAYKAINSIVKKSGGGIDHSKLDPFVRGYYKVQKLDHYETKVTTETVMEGGELKEITNNVEMPIYTYTQNTGRDMGATLSAVVEVVKDLTKRMSVLENK